MKAVREEEVELHGIGFVKQIGLSREWKRQGVIDEQSDETEEEKVIGEVVGDSGRPRSNVCEREGRSPKYDIARCSNI